MPNRDRVRRTDAGGTAGTGSYRLRRIVHGVPYAAEVAVRVEPAGRDDVAVADGVFDWRRAVYGPRAASGGADDRRMVTEAVEGGWYVLARSPGTGGRLVTVTGVIDAPADTGAGHTKFAAVLATCRALGVELDRPPFIDASGIVFPD